VARPTKTLQEHLHDGSFRADRHASLLLGPLVDDPELSRTAGDLPDGRLDRRAAPDRQPHPVLTRGNRRVELQRGRNPASGVAATGSLRTEIGFAEGYYAIGDEVRERTLEGARELLGEDALATAWADGENSSVEELGDEAALVD
jgi:hypothetical protein